MTSNDTNETLDLPITIILEPGSEDPNSLDDIYEKTYHFHGYSAVVPLALLMVVFIFLAVVGNIMVILTIVRHRGMRTRTNMFIVNLAMADILVAVLDMPVSLITILVGGWKYGDALCKLNGFTNALFLICSIHTLMYIAIHKYISITRPFSRAMTPRRIKMMIAAAWIWSILCATGPLIGFNTVVYKKGASQCGPDIKMNGKAIFYSILITTSVYIIPLVVMSFCYFRIFREIHVHMNRIRETSNIDLQSSVSQQKKVSVTLFLVLACFVLCWTPYVLYSNCVAFMKSKENMPYIINPLAYWCGYMNSACNPIIYAFRSPSFRQGYKEIMFCTPVNRLSHVNSLSFRSRSARGSLKSSSNSASTGNCTKIVRLDAQTKRKQRRMLSQTSWRSLPIIPYIIRSLSSPGSNASAAANGKRARYRNNANPETIPEENNSENSSENDGCYSWCGSSQKQRSHNDTERSRKESFNVLNEPTDNPHIVLSEAEADDNDPDIIKLDTRGQNVEFLPRIANDSHMKPPLVRQASFESEELNPEDCIKDNSHEQEKQEFPSSDENWEIVPLRSSDVEGSTVPI